MQQDHMKVLLLYLFFLILLSTTGIVRGREKKKPWSKKKKGTQFDKLPLPEGSCPIGSKKDASEGCLPVQNDDVIDALKWLAYPPSIDGSKFCKNEINVQGFVVCEDNLEYSKTKRLQFENVESLLVDHAPSEKDKFISDPAPTCMVWSVMATKTCDDLGSMEFEKEMAAKGCQVELFQYVIDKKGDLCKPANEHMKSKALEYWGEFKGNIRIHRVVVWAKRCYACVYKEVMNHLDLHRNIFNGDEAAKKKKKRGYIDIMKIQSRFASNGKEGSPHEDDYDGIQFTILADLFLYIPTFLQTHVGQLLVTLPFTSQALVDLMGREGEQGYNTWATARLLQEAGFQAGSSSTRSLYSSAVSQGYDRDSTKAKILSPMMMSDVLVKKIGVDPSNGQHFFQHSFINNFDSLALNTLSKSRSTNNSKRIHHINTYTVPAFCRMPISGSKDDLALLAWIHKELNTRCHPNRMWLECVHDRAYEDPFLPCPQELANALAFDYAVTNNWCDFSHESGAVPVLGGVRVVPGISGQKVKSDGERSLSPEPRKGLSAKQLHNIKRGKQLRLVFFFTVYKDEDSLVRLIKRLYSPDHFYLIHVDPRGSAHGFLYRLEAALAKEVLPRSLNSSSTMSNIALSQNVSIVYGASTASILLSKAMAWCLENDDIINRGVDATSGVTQGKKKWDYFVPLTGFDYPLVSLNGMQTILASSHVPKRGENGGFMPFLMAWSAETSTDVRRLQAKYPQVFSDDQHIRKSIELTWAERGDAKNMGSSPMEMRAYSYAPPLSCHGGFGYYRLETRVSRNDTQWLFPRDGAFRNSRGKANTRQKDEEAQSLYRESFLSGQGRNFNNPKGISYSNFDGEHRMWRKSDPGTSAAYDRRSAEYIVSTEEGRKYYHFFKHMLLGSEEHYYITMLYNWERTRRFVGTLGAQSVWNTWKVWADSSIFLFLLFQLPAFLLFLYCCSDILSLEITRKS